MTIYYVDSNVPDTNLYSATPDFTTYNHLTFETDSGSDLVYKTIADINVCSFNPGDQILFKRGDTWREQLTVTSSGSSENPITFGAYGSGMNPIIDGSDLITGWSAVAINLYKTTCALTPNQVFEDGTRLAYITWNTDISTTYQSMSAGTWTLDTANSILYVWTLNGTTPSTHTIEASHRSYAIESFNNNYLIFHNLTLKNATITNFSGCGTYITIDSVSVSGAYGHGITANRGAAIYFGTTNNYWTVSNNTVYNNGATGIVIQPPVTGDLITGNTVYRNAQLAIDSSQDYSGGIRIIGAYPYNPSEPITNNIVEHNTVYENGIGYMTGGTQRGCGIWFDTVGMGNIMRYNLIYNNRFMGIKLDYDTYASQVYYNIIYGHTTNYTGDGASYGVGIGVDATPHGSKIYNNTVYDNRYGIRVSGQYPAVSNDVLNVEVKNNIVYGSSMQAFVAQLGGENDGINGYGNIYSYNCFGPEEINFISWGLNIFKSTYDAWNSSTGAGMGITDHYVNADPLFVSTSTPDFHLQPISPTINAGINVGLTQDYDGTVIDGSNPYPDIGAFEYYCPPINITFNVT